MNKLPVDIIKIIANYKLQIDHQERMAEIHSQINHAVSIAGMFTVDNNTFLWHTGDELCNIRAIFTDDVWADLIDEWGTDSDHIN